ncbi:MAG: ABC transporter permease [Actinomycetales bacterium]|nr:ABC transporter permease [Actinomycetales bacterium]
MSALELSSRSRLDSRRARARATFGQLLRSASFDVGAVIVVFWIVDAIFWHALAPQDPQALNPLAALQGPTAAHWFGTDWLGRDVFSRTLAGSTSVLEIAPLATLLGIAGGTVVGLVTGYYGGAVDALVMRLVDAFLAFPLVIIAVLVLSLLGTSEITVIVLIGVIFTPVVSRTVRSVVLVERDKEYVASARLRGEGDWYIMTAEILPNVTTPIIVESTVRLGYAIFTAATLSFLSLGIQQPSPDWGLTISLGRQYLQIAPWIVLFPAVALATLVVAVNLVADSIQQVMAQ